LLSSLELRITDGTLLGAEVYVFTDNFTAESAFYKGDTSSKRLFQLVLQLRTLEMNGLVQLQVIHVAGTRMILQGTDGLSRGNLTEGIMAGIPMLQFLLPNQPFIRGTRPANGCFSWSIGSAAWK
jgi:hypothetical protein